MDTMRVAIFCLVWSFLILLVYMIMNTVVFGIFVPEMDKAAYAARNNETGGYVDYDNYVVRTNVIKNSLHISLFIIALIPYAYLFVRLLLKKEFQTQPAGYSPYGPGGGF